MAASSSQELRYMIVFTTEGKPQVVEATDELKAQNMEYQRVRASADDYADGLQRLKSGMGSISRPSTQLVQTQRQLQNSLKSTSKGMMDTGKHTATTNNLLIALTRGAQDAQFGMMGVANNLQQSAELAASASSQMGGMRNVVKGLAASFMNPATGLIVGVTAITVAWQMAESGAFNFGGEIENLDEITEGYVDTIDQLINRMNDLVFGEEDFFDTEQLQQRLTMQQAIQTQEERRLETLREERREFTKMMETGETQNFNQERYQDILNEIQFIEEFIEKSKEKQLELEGEILVKKRAIENEDLARIAHGNQLAEILEEEDKILQKWADYDVGSQIASDIDEMNKSMAEGEDPLAMLGDPSERLKEVRARMQAQLKFEAQIEQQRINLVRQSGDEMKALRMEEQRELEQLANNELINDRQREEMRLMIIEEYNNREVELERKKQEQIRQAREQANQQLAELDVMLSDQRLNIADMTAQGILSISQQLVGESKALNVIMFLAERALAVRQIIMDGVQKTAMAVNQGFLMLANPATSAYASVAFASAAKIAQNAATSASVLAGMSLAEGAARAASSGGGGGFGGGRDESRNPMRDFRGIDSDSIPGRERSAFPKTIRLEDSGGKFLTKLQFAQDQEDEGRYLTDG